jgi:hypothetical protein
VTQVLLSQNVAHHCIEALRYGQVMSPNDPKRADELAHLYAGTEYDFKLIESVTVLLEQSLNDTIKLGNAHQPLLVAFAMLMYCSLVHCPPSKSARFIMRLLRAHPSENAYPRSNVPLLLAAFALSRQDYPGWSNTSPLTPYMRAERAIEVFSYYTLRTQRTSLSDSTHSSLRNLGLLHLLSHSRVYALDDDDVVWICREFWLTESLTIHTLPASFSLSSQTMDDLTRQLSDYPDMVSSHAHCKACLEALWCTYDHKQSPSPTLPVYIFILESICRHETNVQGLALHIMDSFPFPSLSNQFAESLSTRNIVSHLIRLRGHEDRRLQLFAYGQLWLLVTQLSRLEDSSSGGREALEAEILKYETSENSSGGLNQVAADSAKLFSTLFEEHGVVKWLSLYGGVYFTRILECMLQAQNCPRTDPRWETVNEYLSDTHSQLRGLSSFVCLDRDP